MDILVNQVIRFDSVSEMPLTILGGKSIFTYKRIGFGLYLGVRATDYVEMPLNFAYDPNDTRQITLIDFEESSSGENLKPFKILILDDPENESWKVIPLLLPTESSNRYLKVFGIG